MACVLTGRVVMVETVTVPIVDGVLDSGVTCWKENVSDDNQYAYILRVYCADAKTTNPSNLRIGLAQFSAKLFSSSN